jgi:carbon-monoxide dehydrogenase large subunit
VTGKPVKWIEDRIGEPQADSFARDYHMKTSRSRAKDGKITALRVKTCSPTTARSTPAPIPSKFPAGLSTSHRLVRLPGRARRRSTASTPTRPPGGVAYRCSFRVTEAVHAIERDGRRPGPRARHGPGRAAAEELHPPEQFPYKSALGWEYDSGDYPSAAKAMEKIGYAGAAPEQAEKRARGELMGIGISSFTEIVGAGPSKHFDILGIKMFDSAEIRVHPTGKASRASAPSRRARATRRPTRRSSPRSSGIPPATSGRGGRHRHRAVRARHLRRRSTPVAGAAARWPRARSATRREDRRAPARGAARTTSSGRPGRSS